MKTSAILIALGLLTASYLLIGGGDDPVEQEFQMFLGQYGRNYYNEEEYQFRFSIFKTNYEYINKVNSQKKSYTLAMNKFGDWSDEEFDRLLNFTPYENKAEAYVPSNVAIKESVDWVEEGTVNPIQDQGSCGSCYAFAALASIEHETSFFHKDVLKYSEQQVVDCSTEEFGYENLGCDGGFMPYVYDYLTETQGCLAEEYPYTGNGDDTCRESECETKDFIVHDYQEVPANSAQAFKETAQYSVIATGITAGHKDFTYYKEGVFDLDDCSTENNHAVAVVGYGTDENGGDYIKIRNSWGANWGEAGYMRLSTKNDAEGGVCGVFQYGSHPRYRC